MIKLPLLHDGARADWQLWLEAQRVENADAPGGPSFDDETVRIRAAVAGLGAARVRGAMIKDELADGRLVALPFTTWPSEFAYYCVCPEETADHPNVVAFRDWLIEEGECQDEMS